MESTHDTPEVVRLTADALVFVRRRTIWHILMIQRRWEPFRGCWAFPGGHVDPGETFRAAAARELTEETGLRLSDLRVLGIYDHPERDPRGRYVNVAFYTVLPAPVMPTAGDDAAHAAWVSVPWLLRNRGSVAFDHANILADAVSALNRLNLEVPR
ncbi:NUDIX domain-containing protein [Amycolatopsis eburnea]|uniref:NUDIX hydrolase n=1 Tax=Amycolatopsis eburnea TaxID=2267691 RepID=A0A427TCT9_9PSEU|nr:NUDIX hydrolase [Amycolatopsis eburnea]RSD20108.1 NUDIX hydrolase [Amycolatopsis eburnea]